LRIRRAIPPHLDLPDFIHSLAKLIKICSKRNTRRYFKEWYALIGISSWGFSNFLYEGYMDKIFAHDIKILEKVSVKKKRKIPTILVDLTIIGTLIGTIVLVCVLWPKN